MWPALDDLGRLGRVRVGDGQQVCLRVALGVRQDDGGQVRRAVCGADVDPVGDVDPLQLSRLAGEPPAMRHVFEEHSLQPLSARVSEDGVPTIGELDLGERGGGDAAIRQQLLRRLRLQREPVEGMGPEGEVVRRVSDRG